MKEKKKRRQLLGGKCEVIYHGCGWRRGRWRRGGKDSSQGTPPVAALILSQSRLGWYNKTFTAINGVSHCGLFLNAWLCRYKETKQATADCTAAHTVGSLQLRFYSCHSFQRRRPLELHLCRVVSTRTAVFVSLKTPYGEFVLKFAFHCLWEQRCI